MRSDRGPAAGWDSFATALRKVALVFDKLNLTRTGTFTACV